MKMVNFKLGIKRNVKGEFNQHDTRVGQKKFLLYTLMTVFLIFDFFSS